VTANRIARATNRKVHPSNKRKAPKAVSARTKGPPYARIEGTRKPSESKNNYRLMGTRPNLVPTQIWPKYYTTARSSQWVLARLAPLRPSPTNTTKWSRCGTGERSVSSSCSDACTRAAAQYSRNRATWKTTFANTLAKGRLRATSVTRLSLRVGI